MTTNNPFRPIIRTQADLESAWRHLMEPLGFTRHSIWLMFIESDDRPIPQITEIEGALEPPDEPMIANMVELFTQLVSDVVPGARLAFLRSRPGGGGILAGDRGWAKALHEAARQARVPMEVVHLANDHELVPIPMDELLAAV